MGPTRRRSSRLICCTILFFQFHHVRIYRIRKLRGTHGCVSRNSSLNLGCLKWWPFFFWAFLHPEAGAGSSQQPADAPFADRAGGGPLKSWVVDFSKAVAKLGQHLVSSMC